MLFSMQMIELRCLHFGFALHFPFPNMQGAAAGRQAQKQHPNPSLHYKWHITFVDLDKTLCTEMS
jgi:hypothetical protein